MHPDNYNPIILAPQPKPKHDGLRWTVWAILALAAVAIALQGCATVISHEPAPADWPKLEWREVRVGFIEVQRLCGPARQNMSVAGWLWSLGVVGECTLIDFDKRVCWHVRPIDETDTGFDDHELEHCAGKDHVGETVLRDAWAAYKARK